MGSLLIWLGCDDFMADLLIGNYIVQDKNNANEINEMTYIMGYHSIM